MYLFLIYHLIWTWRTMSFLNLASTCPSDQPFFVISLSIFCSCMLIKLYNYLTFFQITKYLLYDILLSYWYTPLYLFFIDLVIFLLDKSSKLLNLNKILELDFKNINLFCSQYLFCICTLCGKDWWLLLCLSFSVSFLIRIPPFLFIH